jgi:hypothetical protein
MILTNILTKQLDAPEGAAQQVHHLADERALTRPVSTQKAEYLTPVDLQRDILVGRLGLPRIHLDQISNVVDDLGTPPISNFQSLIPDQLTAPTN